MTELEAFHDGDLSELERRMLDAARHDRIPNELKLRMAGALAVTAVAAVGAGAATASAAPGAGAGAAAGASTGAKLTGLLFSKVGLWGWLPLAMLAATGVWHVARPLAQPTARPAAAELSQRPRQLKPAAEVGAIPPMAPAAPATASTVPPRSAAKATATTLPSAAHAPALGAEGDLSAEVALLDRARAALASGESRRASRLLDQHRQRFPHGTLDPEAEALRIETLVRLGATERAKELAQRFLRRYPAHPLRDRVVQLLSEATRASP